jgi:hypothetical protein
MGELLNKGNTKKTNKEDIAKKWSELGFLDGLKPMGDKERQRITDLFECEASYLLGEEDKIDTTMGKLKKRIHVNQHVIRRNAKTGEREPVITCKTYKENKYGHQVIIKDDNGKEVARVIYSPDKPLSCGARLWLETENDIEVINENESNTIEM